jgi:small-conductance mechanosensitive channel
MLDLAHFSAWPFYLILGYPALTIAVLELARRLDLGAPFTAAVLRQIAYVLMPTGGLWLILRALAELPTNHWAVCAAETAFSLTGLYILLRLAQAALTSLFNEQMRAPKLLIDTLRIVLSLVWGSVVVARIWNVNLGSLLAAMGVGSIALAFALQEFLGNLLSGLGLLSAHKFSIGDWIMVDGKAAEVVEMDWRTVTLVMATGNRVVIANSTLAKGNLTIAAKGREGASAVVPLVVGTDIPPEQVRDAVLEAADSVRDLIEPDRVKCLVTGIGDDCIKYDVVLSVANPGIVAGPRDEFLSKFWYVAQRRGLRLDRSPGPDAMARLKMLQEGTAFHGETAALQKLAEVSTLHRYRRGDVLLTAGAPTAEVYFVVVGQLVVTVPSRKGEIRIELVAPGELMVLQEMLAGGSSPVRVAAQLDTDVLTIPASALSEAMDRSRLIARDITAVAEARHQAILPLNRGLRIVA